jgi:hypothetical protein
VARFGVRRRLLTPLECDVFAVLHKLWSMSRVTNVQNELETSRPGRNP